MNKKFLKLLATLFACATLAVGFVACEDEQSGSSSNSGNSASTEQSTPDSSTPEDSSSGDSAHEHDYTAVVTAPTCTEQGYTTYTCECEDSYIADYVDALDHEFINYISNNDAKCGVNGTETATCNRDGCNETDTRTDEDSALDHEFINYVSNNDATYEKDGTKTAVCNRDGCNETDTVADEGSKLTESKISFKTLTVNGTNVYGKVSNTAETFSFINEVAVQGDAKFIVSLDLYGIQTVVTKTIPLDVGDNTVYVIEMINGEPTVVYTVTIRRRPTYEVTFDANGGTSVQTQTVEEDSLATTPQTTRAGYTFTAWDYDFTKPITKDTVIEASWTANTNTPYTVEYYLQNLENDEYTLQETVELTGTTDTTATAEIKTFEHFTYNTNRSIKSGNIDGDGSRVLKVYYTRDSYKIATARNNSKAGTVTSINGNYRYEKSFTVTATTNAGYTFLGWYEGEKLVCETQEFTFKTEKSVTYTAKWKANGTTPYKVEYYLQNLENDEYTLQETVELTGTADTTANAEIKTFAHFTYNASKSVISGNIHGNGSQVLKVYYTRNKYTLAINNSSAGSITNQGTYKYDKAITTTATPYLGYHFLGWYSGEDVLSTDLSYTFTVTQNVTAKFEMKAEMSIFNFTSTATTCSITGIKNKAVTEIIVPDYVTSIGGSAFYGCNSLTEITIPFIGASKYATGYQAVFGYIFGHYATSSSSTISGATYQYYYSSAYHYEYYHYYIPTSLRKVTFTGTVISNSAFYNCSRLTSVVIGNGATSIGREAFWGCSRLTGIEIPASVTNIGSSAFYNCSSLTSITIPDGVTSIGSDAFYNCNGLTSIEIPDSVMSIGSSAFAWCNRLTIYCEAKSQPSGWSVEWNSSNRPVVWGYVEGVSCTHEVEYTVSVEPTFETAGELSGYCAVCATNTTVTLPKLNETDYVKATVKEAECDKNGIDSYTITVKDKTVTFEVENTARHTYNGRKMDLNNVYTADEVQSIIPNAPATCLDHSGKGTFVCDDCGKTYMVSLSGDHVYGPGSVISEVPSTCTVAGSKTYQCDVCDKTYTQALPLKAHELGEPDVKVTDKGTADEKVTLTFKCKNCDYTNTIECKDYDVVTTPATCAAPGSIVYTYTYMDGADEKQGEYTIVLEQKLHNYQGVEIDDTKTVEYSKLKEIFGDDLSGCTLIANALADCTSTGYATYVCSDCGKTFMLTVTGDHAWKLSQTIPSDCVTDGKLIYVCENDETHTKTETNTADLKKGHSLVLSEEDSDFEKGKIVFNCANCDHSETIDAIKFEVKVTPATCTTTGERYVEYTYVDKADNNTEKSDRKTLEILRVTTTHMFGTHSLVVDGTKVYTMSELKAIFGENLDGYTPIANSPATCLEEGHGTFVCKDCGGTFMIDVKGDCDFTEWTYVDATCTEDGYKTRTCKVCGDVQKEKTSDKTGHTYIYTVETKATVDSEGKLVVTCEDCDFEKVIVLKALSKDNGYEVKEVVKASCKGEGLTTYTVVITMEEGKTFTYVESVVTEPVEHETMNPPVFTWREDGKEYTGYYCEVCKMIIVTSVKDVA
ncbi:MAG: hypothetical protein E7381_04715 [Clostridiales bacterium]|nr:hypothetical protein [Clostridiales bacterium]